MLRSPGSRVHAPCRTSSSGCNVLIQSVSWRRSNPVPALWGHCARPACRRPCVMPCAALQQPLAALAEASNAVEGVPALLGIAGIITGAVSLALYMLEKQATAKLDADLMQAKVDASNNARRIEQLLLEVEREKQARQDESLKPRLDEATRDIFKLERALEIKDGQLSTFMNTAHEQIRLLEERVKQLQKMD